MLWASKCGTSSKIFDLVGEHRSNIPNCNCARRSVERESATFHQSIRADFPRIAACNWLTGPAANLGTRRLYDRLGLSSRRERQADLQPQLHRLGADAILIGSDWASISRVNLRDIAGPDKPDDKPCPTAWFPWPGVSFCSSPSRNAINFLQNSRLRSSLSMELFLYAQSRI